MNYYVTINTSRQDQNFGTGESPNFGDIQTAWVFEANNQEEIKNSFFTIKNELKEFTTKDEAMLYAKQNADHRFIEFAPHSLVSKK